MLVTIRIKRPVLHVVGFLGERQLTINSVIAISRAGVCMGGADYCRRAPHQAILAGLEFDGGVGVRFLWPVGCDGVEGEIGFETELSLATDVLRLNPFLCLGGHTLGSRRPGEAWHVCIRGSGAKGSAGLQDGASIEFRFGQPTRCTCVFRVMTVPHGWTPLCTGDFRTSVPIPFRTPLATLKSGVYVHSSIDI